MWRFWARSVTQSDNGQYQDLRYNYAIIYSDWAGESAFNGNVVCHAFVDILHEGSVVPFPGILVDDAQSALARGRIGRAIMSLAIGNRISDFIQIAPHVIVRQLMVDQIT
mgnify:CR=1 FL=1